MINQDDIKQFCDQCYFVRALFKKYVYLYDDNIVRLDLLNKTARDFFSNLQNVLKERILLDICKITDSDTFGKDRNLTIEYILKEIDKDARVNLGLDKLSEEIHKFRNYIVPARHKIIVHSDLETIRADKILGEIPEGESDKFWINLHEFVNKIFNHYFKIPFVLDDGYGCTYDVKRLVLALKKAAYFDQHFKNVLGPNPLEEETFKYRNA